MMQKWVLARCCLQDGIRVEKERQRASGRVQQLQAELSAMRSHQDSLRQRLQERLTAQERDAAAKTRELASLRRAGELGEKLALFACQFVYSPGTQMCALSAECPGPNLHSSCQWRTQHAGPCLHGVFKNTNLYIVQRQEFQHRRGRGMHAVGRT
jgi:hypothetical protein